jgi:hypothetical protein
MFDLKFAQFTSDYGASESLHFLSQGLWAFHVSRRTHHRAFACHCGASWSGIWLASWLSERVSPCVRRLLFCVRLLPQAEHKRLPRADSKEDALAAVDLARKAASKAEKKVSVLLFLAAFLRTSARRARFGATRAVRWKCSPSAHVNAARS